MLVGIRALQGVALAALPALAVAHITREVAPAALGSAVGMIIAGNTVGGMSGRLLATTVEHLGGWRVALLAVGTLSVLATVAFRVLLPAPVGGPAQAMSAAALPAAIARHLRDPGLLCCLGLAFLLMSAFVTVYNYLGFRLLAPPFALPAALASALYLLAYYTASSIGGTVGGIAYDHGGWVGVVGYVAALFGAAGVLVVLLRRVPVVG